MKNTEENGETIVKIWKTWKKSKLNSEILWKL